MKNCIVSIWTHTLKAFNCPVLITEVGLTKGYTFIHLLCAIYALNMDRVCTCMHDPCACQNIACKRDFITDPPGHPRFMCNLLQ